jgi:hypothetical protein
VARRSSRHQSHTRWSILGFMQFIALVSFVELRRCMGFIFIDLRGCKRGCGVLALATCRERQVPTPSGPWRRRRFIFLSCCLPSLPGQWC